MTRIFSILIAMLAAVVAAAGVRLPSGAKHFVALDNTVAYFQQVSSAAGTGTYTHLQRTCVRRYTGAGHVIDNDSVKMTRFPGGYLDRGGNAFYYLTDYQGNNIAVVDAAGFITQRTYYYPYGEPWRYPDGQQYLFSDKELTRADGRHAYTFSARALLPNLPRWTTPDPHSESYYSVSPYSYCAANPIMAIDPNGSDTFLLSPTGELLVQIPDDINDSFCIMDITADVLPSLTMPYGTINSYFSTTTDFGESIGAYTLNSFGKAMQLFEFFADNTTSEWSLFDNTNSNQPKAFLSTSFQKDSEASAPHLIHSYKLVPSCHYHNHHNTPHPSSGNNNNNYTGDINFARRLCGNDNSNCVNFYIYFNGEYFPYSTESDKNNEKQDGYSAILNNINCNK